MYKTQIDPTQVKAFLDAYFKNPVEKFETVTSGEFSQAYAFENAGARFILRFNSYSEEGFHKEVIVHTEYSAIPTPRIVDIGEYEGFHYSLTEAYKGVQLHKLDTDAMQVVLPSLFETMNTIHTQPVKGERFGMWGLDQNGSCTSFETQLRFFIHADKWDTWAAKYPFFDLNFANKLMGEFDSLVAYIPAERYFLHGDFGRTNIFALNGKIEGVIDWSEAMYGDFLLDLAWCAFWESRVDMVAAYYTFNKTNSLLDLSYFEQRMRLYLLFSALNNIGFDVARGREDAYHNAILAAKRVLKI